MAAGKILPVDREIAFDKAVADGEGFDTWIKNRPGRPVHETLGAQRPIQGAEGGNAREEFATLASQKAEELLKANPRLSPARAKAQAAELVRKEHPELAARRRHDTEREHMAAGSSEA